MRKPEIQNASMKILAVALAILLWFYVGIEKNPVESRYYQVPVTIENLSDDLTATMSKKHVTVTVRARANRLSSVNANDFTATVDLSKAKVGDNSCTVYVKTPKNIHISKVSPNEINVNIDRMEGQHVEIDINQVGVLAEGLAIHRIEVEPKAVFLAGNQKAVNKVSRAEVELDLSQIHDSGEVDLPIKLLDAKGDVVAAEGIEMRPNHAMVRIDVDKDEWSKTVPVLANIVGSPANNLSATVEKISPNSVKITGEKRLLDQINAIQTEDINVADLTQSKTFQVYLLVPEGIEIKGNKSVDVTVQITKKKESDGEATIKLPIKLLGEPASGRAVVVPSEAMVRYRGKQEAAASLSATVNVNGLSLGIHQLNINVTPLEQVVILNIMPQTVQVTVTDS